MALIRMIAIIAEAIDALVGFLSKTAVRQRQKIAKITEAQALGFRKIRKAINVRNKAGRSFSRTSASDSLPDDPYKRD